MFGVTGKTHIETYAEMPTINKEADKLEKHVSEKWKKRQKKTMLLFSFVLQKGTTTAYVRCCRFVFRSVGSVL